MDSTNAIASAASVETRAQALFTAIEAEDFRAARALIDVDTARQVNDEGTTALMFAANAGNAELVKTLLPLSDAEAQDEIGATALMWAARHNFAECVSLLLPASDARAEDQNGDTALMWAVENLEHVSGLESVRLLSGRGAALIANGEGETPLMLAARRGDVECVKELLPVSDLAAQDLESEMTALHWAAHAGRLQWGGYYRGSATGLDERQAQVIELLAPKSDLAARTLCGKTPLLIAAERGSASAIAALIERSDLAAADHSGRTALHYAAEADPALPTVCLRAIIAGSNPAACTRDGETALMLAARRGNAAALAELLPLSDPTALNGHGRTALGEAIREQNSKCADLLAPVSAPKEAAKALKKFGAEEMPRFMQFKEAKVIEKAAAQGAKTAQRAEAAALKAATKKGVAKDSTTVGADATVGAGARQTQANAGPTQAPGAPAPPPQRRAMRL
ncbi:ankyrin repeat protein [Paraburkholderia fungorum]|jgi:ankyrin repeat protein|uniref:ankyrin repeat domain-containing protein n=1 Tax=Paraburkholderia fungorum TaxID=134537 RepID=UPI000D06C378|nr:ankyrin repeat domain-containing protein [Paraburkholderia fungorum]PRZ56449.1 ankyrin repeat protein [Paraburkholderia fungorum]